MSKVRAHWRCGVHVREHYRRPIVRGDRVFKNKINRILKVNPGLFNSVRSVRIEPATHKRLGVSGALARTDVHFDMQGKPSTAVVKLLPNMNMTETAKTIVHEDAHTIMDKCVPNASENVSELYAREKESEARIP